MTASATMTAPRVRRHCRSREPAQTCNSPPVRGTRRAAANPRHDGPRDEAQGLATWPRPRRRHLLCSPLCVTGFLEQVPVHPFGIRGGESATAQPETVIPLGPLGVDSGYRRFDGFADRRSLAR
jgi:hypothetical protein